MSSERTIGNYLLCSSPVHGHVEPMRAIGCHLVAQGHRVRLLTGSRFQASLSASGIEHAPLSPSCDYDDRDLDGQFPRRRLAQGMVARARFDVELMFVRSITEQYGDLVEQLDQFSPDAVLVETMFTGALPLLLGGTSERPPVLGCGVVPLMLSSRGTAPFGSARPPPASRLARGGGRIATRSVHQVMFGDTQHRANRQLHQLGAAPLPVFLTDWPRLTDRYLQLTCPGFEYPRSDLPGNVEFVGPVLPRPSPQFHPLSWWPALDDARPTVHVTQGTLATADPDKLIGPTLRGLREQDMLIVVTTAGPRIIETTVGDDHVRVADFLPYRELLAKVDVMVTNGGYGGVQCALAHAVPLVVAGDSEDKPEIAARVAWSGAGIDLRTGRPHANTVRRAVREIVESPRYRVRARALANEISTYDALTTITTALATTKQRQ